MMHRGLKPRAADRVGKNTVTFFDHTVLQVVPRLGSGGAERTTVEMARAIVNAGGRALVATAGGRLEEDVRRAGGSVIHLPVDSKNPVSLWLNAGRLAGLIRREDVSLVHARSRAPAWSALWAARECGKPFVTTWHGAHEAAGPVKRLYNSSLVRGDMVIANSRFTGERIERDYHIKPERLRVIPRGADIRAFDPAAVSQSQIDALAAAWGLGADAPESAAIRFLLPARLTEWKGHRLAVNAVARLKPEIDAGNCPKLTLVFCGGAQGETEYARSLRAEIDDRGVGDMVHMVGECADMPAAFGWADAALAPSLRPEPFGRVAVEAGAMEKPMIAPAHGGYLETIVDGETGLHFAPGDAAALSRAIAELAGDRAKRQRLGEAAAARVRAVYSADAMCDATLAVYRDILSQGA